MNSQIWLENLGIALRDWIQNSSDQNAESLSLQLGVNKRIVLRVMKGEYIVAEKSDPNFYAKLFRITGLPEADPRSLPPEKNGRVRAWSDERLDLWWNMYYPQDQAMVIEEDVNPSPWVEFCYKELTELMHGTVEMRETFYLRNHSTLDVIIQLFQVLNQREAEREESLHLMEVLKK